MLQVHGSATTPNLQHPNIQQLFAAIPVTDVAAIRAWLERRKAARASSRDESPVAAGKDMPGRVTLRADLSGTGDRG